MRTVIEIIIAFLAAGGLFVLGWFLFGRLLVPVVGESAFAVVSAEGTGGQLEHQVAGLLWLRSGGLARFTIVIVDNGLDSAGLAVAAALLDREPGILFCSAGRLEECLRNVHSKKK